MATFVVKHRVISFEAWKPEFDANEPDRVKAGITGHSLHVSADDPQEVTIVFRTTNLGRVKEFSRDPKLAEVMHKAGVVDKPTFLFLNDAESKNY
jgi:hypothetical protein